MNFKFKPKEIKDLYKNFLKNNVLLKNLLAFDLAFAQVNLKLQEADRLKHLLTYFND